MRHNPARTNRSNHLLIASSIGALLAIASSPAFAASDPEVETAYRLLEAGNHEEAFAIINPLLLDGENKDALGVLGMAYMFGMGVKQDGQKAVELCRESAEANQPKGMHCLGHAYMFGSGSLEVDYVQANYWWSKAAEQDDLESITHLGDNYLTGSGVEVDLAEGVRLLKRAAENGEPYAALQLGDMYGFGLIVEKDNEKKRHYWEIALESGLSDSEMLMWLGSLYLRDELNEEQMAKGMELINEAVENQYPPALLRMGYMCLTGTYVEQDLNCAETFFSKANERSVSLKARIGLWITRMAKKFSPEAEPQSE